MSGGATYLWSTGDTGSNLLVSPTTTTTYSVTVTDTNGCTDIDNVEVEVYGLPTPSVVGPAEICNQGTADLVASGGASYLWSEGSTTALIAVSPSVTSTYSVTVTDANGCTATTSHTVIVNTNTTASVTSGVELCEGEQVDITASGGVSYVWSTGETTATINANPSATTTYIVTVTDSNGCTATSESTVIVHPLPTADAGLDTNLCIGESQTLTASGGATYLWSTGDTGNTLQVSPTSTAMYNVTVTDVHGCTAEATVTVTVNDLPIISVTQDLTICEGETADLSVTGGGNYLWSTQETTCLLYTSPSPRDATLSRMPSSA